MESDWKEIDTVNICIDTSILPKKKYELSVQNDINSTLNFNHQNEKYDSYKIKVYKLLQKCMNDINNSQFINELIDTLLCEEDHPICVPFFILLKMARIQQKN